MARVVFQRLRNGASKALVPSRPAYLAPVFVPGATGRRRCADRLRCVIGLGCTVGHGPSGLAVLATGSLLGLASIITEAALVIRLEARAEPSLVAALHTWFDAQLSDHGKDAMAGHEHHQHHSTR